MKNFRYFQFWVRSAMAAGLCVSATISWAQTPLPPNLASQANPDLTMPRRVEGYASIPRTPASILAPEAEPIDLASALQLAGIRNPEILLARQAVALANAENLFMAAQILPTINLGTNLDMHTGALQQSNGHILKVDRNALYFGAGAYAVGTSTVQIPGVVWNMNLSVGIFNYLTSRQEVRQAEFHNQAEQNQMLLRVAVAYVELLRAEGRRAVVLKNQEEGRSVAVLTESYVKTGVAKKADADRAKTDLSILNTQYMEAEGEVITASARLAQLINVDPSIRLHAMEGQVVPMALIREPLTLQQLILTALWYRPEMRERRAAIQAAIAQLDGAKWLPFSPTLLVGYSAGSFGGGSNLAQQGQVTTPSGQPLQGSNFGSYAPRTDFDVVFYWSIQNMGLGNVALIRQAKSRLGIANLEQVRELNRIRMEVAQAYARSLARLAQIQTTQEAVRSGELAYKEDTKRIAGGVGLPIELLESRRLLGRSRIDYLNAISDYNAAQFDLFVALGQPPQASLAASLTKGDVLPIKQENQSNAAP